MALAYLCGVIVLFTLVLVCEGPPGAAERLRPAGLLRWLMAGNWTAKLGALLLSIGSGALLRYLMLNITVPPAHRIMAGIGLAALFGAAAALLGSRPQRRALSLALTGASLGVSYLTAYCAYAYFHFVADVQALGLLFMVASIATVIATTRRALSIAVLAMVGAYMAPAFALHSSDPLPVYGYYIAASLVTLLMVWLRGWRPLIHLSFLFTLAGALFFGWTQKFYTPDYYPQMQQLLLILVAIHLAMPLLEGRASQGAARGTWARTFDRAYFLALPLIAGVLTLILAPRIEHQGALGFAGLALLWLIAAGWQRLSAKESGSGYAAIAIAFLLFSAWLAISGVPLLLSIGVLGCLTVAAGPRLRFNRVGEILALGTALTGCACYVLQALFVPVSGVPLLNLLFAEHLLLAAALLLATWSLRRRDHDMTEVFGLFTGVWLLLALGRELARLDFTLVAELIHFAVLILIVVIVSLTRTHALLHRPSTLMACGVVLFMTSMLCAAQFSPILLASLLLADQVLYSLLARRCTGDTCAVTLAAPIARAALPILALPWAIGISRYGAASSQDITLTLLTCSALFASWQSQWLTPRDKVWSHWTYPVTCVFFSVILFYETLCHIERDAWAVAFELLALLYLIDSARCLWGSTNRYAAFFSYLATAAIPAVSSAMLLRLMGPPGSLTILALDQIVLPAFVSLTWSAIGAVLTWLSIRRKSRMLWSLGALLMIAAALKLILLDFGSLGRIGNILAMMAAGGVFLLVAWIAPFPPKAERAPTPQQATA